MTNETDIESKQDEPKPPEIPQVGEQIDLIDGWIDSSDSNEGKPSIPLPLSPSKIPAARANRFPNRPKLKRSHAGQLRAVR
jgi:hypothetical protein